MAVATSSDHGHNLQTVQLLIKKNQVSPVDLDQVSDTWRSRSLLDLLSPPLQTLQKEVQGHQPRINGILQRSQSLLKDETRRRQADLQQLWGRLTEEVELRHGRLEEAHKAQQYYFDAAEAEAWMSEQELYMMSEEKAKVCGGGASGRHMGLIK